MGRVTRDWEDRQHHKNFVQMQSSKKSLCSRVKDTCFLQAPLLPLCTGWGCEEHWDLFKMKQGQAMSSTAAEGHHGTTHAGEQVRLKALSVMPWNGHLATAWLGFQPPWRVPVDSFFLWAPQQYGHLMPLDSGPGESLGSITDRKNGTLALPVKCLVS